ncbi:MAG: hypothetical protein K9M55_02520 [Candidatus Marinimicrobia bacterium]|nr:hypothetical protein [Candidatus Neomarinimicrobiota bacterium]MCF7921554.1 hypothetical protein [Candidatus Neomarinimicrobiota bacterium]
MRSLLAISLLFIWSCEWRPDEIQIDSTATIENINVVIGDTISLHIEGSNFSLIQGLDNAIAEVNDVVNVEQGRELEIIGLNPGALKLFFKYTSPTASDSEPVTASYLIHLGVTESIPLSVNVGEQLQLDISTYLSLEQLVQLDTIAIIVAQEIPGGEISIEELADSTTGILIYGLKPGYSGLQILCLDSNNNQIAAFTFMVEISIHKVVLAELFTNTGCVNCPQANEYLDRISAEFGNDFALVRYHVNWTDPFDPMNLYNPGEVESRRAYYNIFAAPGLVLDGTLVTTLDEDDWSGRVSNATLQIPQVYISAVDIVESIDSLHLQVDVNSFGTLLADLTVWSLVFEDSIEYAGSNGETLHMNVMRDMAFSSIGELNTLNTIRHSLKKPDDYGVAGPMNLMVFIQSEDDKSILQTRKQKLY